MNRSGAEIGDSKISRQKPAGQQLSLPDDPRLLQAVQEYQAELEAGRRPSRQEFLARYADLGEALATCLEGLDLVQQAAPALQSSSPANKLVVDPLGQYPTNPLGDFQIISEIGRGGMGVVYEAVQLSLGRRVALKVLPFASALDARHLQRFKNEAQAAAQLHHAHIVPVHFVGCERGVHFYAMQMIDGQSLATIIRQLRQQDGLIDRDGLSSLVKQQAETLDRPRSKGDSAQAADDISAIAPSAPKQPTAAGDSPRSSTVAQMFTELSTQHSRQAPGYFHVVARMGRQAAEALEHAHQAGVVHRDIKPANLLVDGQGHLWVTDFGLAQVHSEVGLTQTGDLLGTLLYTSPEQAMGQRAQVDHRTDIYSLGATLYELLTLETLFSARTRQGLLQQILNEEPRSPRAWHKSIPVELETIVLKAISKNPVDRYATAQDFADDLKRFLDDKPILARRPSLWDRTRKWSRRHPSVVGAGLLLLALGVVGLVVNNWLISKEQDKTRAALKREQQRAEESEKRFQQAKRAVDLLLQISEDEMADKPFLQGIRKQLLEAVLVFYQEFLQQRRDDPLAQKDLTATQARIKQILGDLAILQGAEQIFMLADTAVLNDLNPPPDQRKLIRDLATRLAKNRFGPFPDFRRLTLDQWQRRFLEVAKANDKEMAAVMTTAQLRRLKEIALWRKGTHAFTDSEVAAKLKLTKQQKEQIRTIEGKTFGEVWESMREPETNLRQVQEKIIRKAVASILALLTPGQKAKWDRLAGQPYTGPLGPQMMRPPGPPGGPGARGGPDRGTNRQ